MSPKSKATTSKRQRASAAPKSAQHKTNVRRNQRVRGSYQTTTKLPISSKLKKADIVNELTRMLSNEGNPVSRVQVRGVLDGLGTLLERSLQEGGVGEFKIPGLIKVERYVRPPTNARPARNMQTKESIMIPAQPERLGVRCKPLIRLKRMVGSQPHKA